MGGCGVYVMGTRTVIYYLNFIVAISAILASGYILARIQMRMRILASGSLLAFGILHLHNTGDAAQVINLLTHLAIVVCIVYFATVANAFVNMSAQIRKVQSDRVVAKQKEIEPKTDFPLHDIATNKDTQNVARK